MDVIVYSMQVIFIIAIFIHRANNACGKEVDIANVSDIIWSLLDHSPFLVVSEIDWIFGSILVVVAHPNPHEQLHHENASNVDSIDTI